MGNVVKFFVVFIIALTGLYFLMPSAKNGHLLNLFHHPKNLYEPIVVDAFNIWEKGFKKEYSLNPKYSDFYEIGIFNKTGISADYKFNGKIKITFFRKNKVLQENIVTNMLAGYYLDKGMKYYKQISLFEFPVPLKGWDKNCSIVLEVLEPDTVVRQYINSVQLYVSVSGRQ